MSDQDGGDRPRWEGFPGGVDPLEPASHGDDQPTGPVPGWEPAAPAAPEAPVPPTFPVQGSEPAPDETAPIPVVGATPVDPDGSGLGPRRSRAQAAPRPDTSRYVAFACAAAVVLVGAGFAFVACNNEGATSGGTQPAALPAASSTPSPTPTVTRPSTTPSPTPTRSATPSRSASVSPSATSTGDTEPSPSASPSATAAAAKQPVVILNSTRITGLAKRVAADVRTGGWTVPKTTNWTGAKPSVSTIYYLPGKKNKASAELFAKKFAVAKAVKPALPGMTSNLTLVLTSDAS